MELSNSNIKKFLKFFQKKAFLIFWETPKNRSPEKILCISGNVTFLYFKKLLVFQDVTFRARKVKRTHS